jgi:hypothetical protein
MLRVDFKREVQTKGRHDMNIRKKLTAFALAAATLTTVLGTTVLSSTASAHHYTVSASRTDQVGSEWWSGSKFYMSTDARLYQYGTRIYATTAVWTTSWVGFTGCVRVDMFDSYGRYLGSTPDQQIGTTGLYGDKRYVGWSSDLPYWLASNVHRLGISHWHCPKA